jgi:hypothetical protein
MVSASLGPIQVQVIDTGADTDALSGTDLTNAPGRGRLRIWIASTVNTATLTLTIAGTLIARAMSISLRSNGMPSISDDPPVCDIGVDTGEKITANLGGTTGTIYTIARWDPL